jgi:hypothetical protein
MSSVRALLSALGASLGFTLAGGGDKLAFEPQAGSSLTKTYTIGGEFTLDDISLIVDGQDIGGMLGQIEVNVKTDSRIEVTDAYRAVAGGRPTDLLRTFEALASSVHVDMTPAQPDMPEMCSTSSLEGKSVVFRWNEEENEYERSFHEEDGDEDLLEGLEEDMDLRAFLPPGEVSDGDTWSVELDELQSLLAPGGNLSMLPEDGDMDEEAMKQFEEIFGNFDEEFGDLLEGECKCTFKGARDEGGVRVAEVEIEIEVSATLDLTELLDKAIRAAIEQSGAEEMVEVTLDTADFNLDFAGKGALLWNLGAGRMHSFQVDGEATMDIDLSVSVQAEGEGHELDASLELSGSMREEVAAKE